MEPQFPVLCSSKPLKAGLEKFERIHITTDVFKLGSGQQNTVVMPFKCLSKDHCIFKKEEDSWILENSSYSSIKINENKLSKGQKQKLCDQDVIKLESSNEFVYKFTANDKKSTLHKKQKANEDNLQKESPNKKKSVLRSHNTDVKSTENKKLKEQVMLDKDKKEKQIYDDYTIQIEKLKGSKTAVKRQTAVLKMQRDIQLKQIRAKIEDQISSLTAEQNDKPPEENNHSEEKTTEDELTSDSEVPGGARPKNVREKYNKRQKERKELRELRREVRQFNLVKEQMLKELEKLHRKDLKEKLNEVKKKLASEIEMHETEKKRLEQLLSQKVSTSKLVMESELKCSICSELFIHATTLGCGHSYCRYCIQKHKCVNRNDKCPTCSATIKLECSSKVLDSLIDKMAELSIEKERRQQLVNARDELEAEEAAVFNRRNDNHRYSTWVPTLRTLVQSILPHLNRDCHIVVEIQEIDSSESDVNNNVNEHEVQINEENEFSGSDNNEADSEPE